MRQLSVEARLQSGEAGSGGLDFLELRLSAETVGLIGRADLRQVTLPPGRQVAIFSPPRPGVWTNARRPGPGRARWSRGPASRGCSRCCATTCRMVRRRIFPASSAGCGTPFRQRPGRAGFPFPPPQARFCTRPAVSRRRCGSAPASGFSACCAARNTAPIARAVIIGNGGRDPHYGSARIGVEFARRLAAEGIASLRIDFAGLGDSPGPPGQERVLSHMFETDRRPDISAAIDVLEGLGFRRFVVQGLCAGAYHAFHAALADPRIGTLLLVNMPLFRWQTGWTIGSIYGQMSLADPLPPATWPQGDLAAAAAGRCRYRQHCAWSVQPFARPRCCVSWPRCLGGAAAGLRRASHGSCWRNVGPERCFSSHRAMPASTPSRRHSDRWARRCAPSTGRRCEIVPGLDHDLNDRATRQTAVECMIDFLQAAVASEDANAPGVHPDAMLS